EAADNFTEAAKLEYIIYKSLTNNLDSIESIEANGTVATNENIKGMASFTVSGLNEGTTYYLNIIVKDQAGNKVCYNSASTKTLNKPSEDSDNKKTSASVQTDTVKTETGIYVIDLMGASGGAKEVKTGTATLIIPSNMLTAEMLGTAQTAELVVGKADTSGLPAELQAQIGSRPVIELALKLDGKTTAWNNPDAPVTVSIPYVPTAEELKNPENITVWYIDGSGNAVAVPNGRYDPATGRVTFTTSHFSSFAVVYVSRSFNDIRGYEWAEKQIEVLAAKGIMNGRTEKQFEPSADITRAEYIGALVRALGVTAQIEDSFADVGKGSSYYDEIATAKKLGITNGTGNGYFMPEETISRQDMLVMTERALRSLKRIKRTGDIKALEQYTDKEDLAAYAVDSIASLVLEGLAEGSRGRLNVRTDATRAEAAVFLYRIYNLQ
ncbi:MAG TPA: S-layer homology domain-containing protein, partial [Clostridia bacterium]|nr:S-layer homology domain-containing protein [Clostridia bacterium]